MVWLTSRDHSTQKTLVVGKFEKIFANVLDVSEVKMHQANGVPPFVTGIKYKEGGYYAVRSLDVVWRYVSDATNRSVPAYLNCNAKLESESKAKAHNSTTNLSKSKQLWPISKPKPRRRATKRQSREAKAELERKLKKITQESDNYSKDIEDLEKERANFKKDADDLSDKLEVEKKVRAQKDARIKRLEGACRMQQPHLLHPFFISSGSTTTPNAMLVAEIAWQRTNWRYCLLR